MRSRFLIVLLSVVSALMAFAPVASVFIRVHPWLDSVGLPRCNIT